MNRNDGMEIGVPTARRWLTLLALVTTAVLATLALTAVLSSPADASSHSRGGDGGGGGGGSDSTLIARLNALEARILELETTVKDQGGEITALEAANTAQDTKITALETLLAGVTRETVNGATTLRFSGMNVQIVNGTGTTDGAPNGLGNLIVGYDAARSSVSGKSGSHYLVVGDEHNYTRFGGIVAGLGNTASGNWASVTGGQSNMASGEWASVSGGQLNTASGAGASVTGGLWNRASESWASVSGGVDNEANGALASVSGGQLNTASGWAASILGGGGDHRSLGITVATPFGIYPAAAQ
jgi:uncharacterized coiled-coil protein SlyX